MKIIENSPRLYALLGILVILLVILSQTGCVPEHTADKRQREETDKRMSEAFREVGMPDITNWTELKLARDIMELRDGELTTYTYIVNMHGDLIFLGESIGYGLPYSVQFSNPEKIVNPRLDVYESLPQAEPNGLFMPDGLSATWVLLLGEDGKAHPTYVEPPILVSPIKLNVEAPERR